jgi:diguanylate cyclase (GGDEF)-like protein
MKREAIKMTTAVAFTLSVLASYSVWNYHYEKKRLIAQIDKQLFAAAVGVPYVLSDDFHDRALKINDINKSEDDQNIENLSKLNNRLGTKFLYTVIKDSKGMYRLTSSSALAKEIQDGTEVHYFTAYPDASAKLKQSFQRKTSNFHERNAIYKPLYVPIYSDRWGTYRSVFVPMRTSKGHLYAVGVDMDISYVKTLLEKNTIKTLLEFLLFTFAILPIIFTYITMLKRKSDEYKQVHKLYIDQSKRSITDPLTQLYNRYKLDQELQVQYENYREYGKSFALLMIDLDHFKSINDRYGHPAGDKVLKQIANVLKTSSRSTDTVGRWGGEEFMIIYPNSDLQNGFYFAEKLRSRVEDLDIENAYGVTISIGVSVPHQTMSLLTLLQTVDDALYKAKQAGRNQTVKA